MGDWTSNATTTRACPALSWVSTQTCCTTAATAGDPVTPLPPEDDLDENRLRWRVGWQQVGYAVVIDYGSVWIDIAAGERGNEHGSRLLQAELDTFPRRMAAGSSPPHLYQWYRRDGFTPGVLSGQECLVRPRTEGGA